MGRRHISVPSFREAFCVAPNAAWSCFSTAVILFSKVVMSTGAVACAIGYVDGSFSYTTMSSTSYKRF